MNDSLMTKTVSDRLRDAGAVVVGFADLAPLDETTRQGFPRAVSFAMPLSPSIVAGIAEGPTEAYAGEYSRLNSLLTQTAQDIAAFIETRGWRAQARPATGDWSTATLRAPFQHKTAATLAGLGWIGKCVLLDAARVAGRLLRPGGVLADLGVEVLCHGVLSLAADHRPSTGYIRGERAKWREKSEDFCGGFYR
jgi:epoxyqueuosine reductase